MSNLTGSREVKDFVKKIALGTVQFGVSYGISNTLGQTPVSEVQKILKFALSQGIDTFDTAPAYGTSEEVIGKFLGGVKNARIVSKLPSRATSEKPVDLFVSESLRKSLKNLRCIALDACLVHNEDDLLGTDRDNLWNGLKDAKNDGHVQKIGVSSYNPEKLKRILDTYDVDIIQVPFNLLDRRFFSDDLRNLYEKKNIEVHIRSVFLQGLFFLKPDQLPPKMEFARETLQKLQHLTALGLQEISLASLGSAFLRGEISKVVLGVTTQMELSEILVDSFKPLDFLIDKEVSQLWKLTDGKILDPRKWA